MKTLLKTAVIGVGNMGSNHARVLSEISDLVALCDINKNRTELATFRHTTKLFTDYKLMLNQVNLDAVVVAVPVEQHFTIAKDCLTSGTSCLVEKPITGTVTQGHDLLKLSKIANLVLMPGHIERFNPAVIAVKNLIDQGKLGTIVSLLALRLGINPPSFTNADVTIDLGIHDVDIFQYLLGETAQKVFVLKHKVIPHNQADAAHIMLQFTHATGMIQTNWITPHKTRHLTVTGTKGMAIVDYITQELQFVSGNQKSDVYNGFLDLLKLSEIPWQAITVQKQEPLRKELEFFLDAVQKEDTTITQKLCQDALSALEQVTN